MFRSILERRTNASDHDGYSHFSDYDTHNDNHKNSHCHYHNDYYHNDHDHYNNYNDYHPQTARKDDVGARK